MPQGFITPFLSTKNYKNKPPPLVASHHSNTHKQSSRPGEMEGTKRYDGEFDNLKATELRLGLPGTDDEPKKPARGVKRAVEDGNDANIMSEANLPEAEAARPPAK